MTTITKIDERQYNVTKIEPGTGKRHVFAIIEADAHTAQMLSDFLDDPEKLNFFGDLIIQHGPGNAYRIYNGLQPIQPPQDDE
jgi:hypothetical protein